MADLCDRCLRPSAECLAYPYGDAKLVLGCREVQLENTQRELVAARALIAHAHVLLLRTRDALDLALAETEPDEVTIRSVRVIADPNMGPHDGPWGLSVRMYRGSPCELCAGTPTEGEGG